MLKIKTIQCKDCGKEITITQYQVAKKRCDACQKIITKANNYKHQKAYNKRHGGNIVHGNILCYCPGCYKLHKTTIEGGWSGRGMPHIYCTNCKVQLENHCCLQECELHYMKAVQ